MPVALSVSILTPSEYPGTFDLNAILPTVQHEGQGLIVDVTNVSGITGLTSVPALAPNWDPEFHEVFWVHKLSEAILGADPLDPYSAPTNLPSYMNNPNVKYGKRAGWGNLPAGVYTVTTQAWKGGEIVAEQTAGPFTYITADEAYPTTQTICLASDGNFTGKPTGAQEVTSLSAAYTILSGASVPMRLLIKRDEVLEPTGRLLFNDPGDGYLNMIDEWGTGTEKPEISTKFTDGNGYFYFAGSSGGTVQNNIDHFVCRNIKFTGDWDPSVCEGRYGNSPFYFNDHNVPDTMIVIADCDMTGLFFCDIRTEESGSLFFTNNFITDWMDYAVYGGGGDSFNYVIEGNNTRQNVNGLNSGPASITGDQKKNSMFPRHGCLRITGARALIACYNDGLPRQGWSNPPTPSVDQTWLRAYGAGVTTPNAYTHIYCNVAEAGTQAFCSLAGENVSATENDGNHIVELNVGIATAMTSGGTSSYIHLDLGGTTIRNNYIAMPNAPGYHGGVDAIILRRASSGATTANLNSPIRIHNNTFVTFQSAANYSGSFDLYQVDANPFVTVEIADNIRWAPDISSPITPGFTMERASNFTGITAAYKGVGFFPEQCWTVGGAGTISGSGGTVNFNYPSGTTQASWAGKDAGDNGHALNDGTGEGGAKYYANEGDFTVTFGASNITVTNNSGSTWTAATKQLRLDDSVRVLGDGDGSYLDDTYESPSALPIARPTTVQASTGGFEVYGTVLAPPTSASSLRTCQGALEPA